MLSSWHPPLFLFFFQATAHQIGCAARSCSWHLIANSQYRFYVVHGDNAVSTTSRPRNARAIWQLDRWTSPSNRFEFTAFAQMINFE
ncbi:MAG: hypothetical protein DMG96_13840 [Acidobacteria bacterium]|nr:MAG: hypothetical protein DMG96_13840 [Acidobacteriota bacterium]